MVEVVPPPTTSVPTRGLTETPATPEPEEANVSREHTGGPIGGPGLSLYFCLDRLKRLWTAKDEYVSHAFKDTNRVAYGPFLTRCFDVYASLPAPIVRLRKLNKWCRGGQTKRVCKLPGKPSVMLRARQIPQWQMGPHKGMTPANPWLVMVLLVEERMPPDLPWEPQRRRPLEEL